MKKIGVFGSAVDSQDSLNQKSRKLGEQIARTGNSIVTGACTGLPLYAVLGAKSLGGYSIGFSATYNQEKHMEVMGTSPELYDSIILIPEHYKYKDNVEVCRKYRNVESVAACDAAIFISGRWGTLNELSNAYDMNKIIGILGDTGGVTDHVQLLLNSFKKATKSQVFFEKDPLNLIDIISQKLQ